MVIGELLLAVMAIYKVVITSFPVLFPIITHEYVLKRSNEFNANIASVVVGIASLAMVLINYLWLSEVACKISGCS
jgi:hypothetical protein